MKNGNDTKTVPKEGFPHGTEIKGYELEYKKGKRVIVEKFFHFEDIKDRRNELVKQGVDCTGYVIASTPRFVIPTWQHENQE